MLACGDHHPRVPGEPPVGFELLRRKRLFQPFHAKVEQGRDQACGGVLGQALVGVDQQPDARQGRSNGSHTRDVVLRGSNACAELHRSEA